VQPSVTLGTGSFLITPPALLISSRPFTAQLRRTGTSSFVWSQEMTFTGSTM
jgi:hypothetical protein